MAISLVQTISGNGGGYANSNAQVFGSDTTSGNLIVVAFTANGSDTIDSITDSQSNSYTLIDAQPNERQTWLYYAKNITGGACTVTVTLGSGQYSDNILIAQEYSGLDPTAPLDQAISGDSGGSYVNSHSSGASSATTQNDELVVATVGCSGGTNPGFSLGSGYSNLTYQAGADAYTYAAIENKIISTTGAQTGTFSSSEYIRSETLLATFKMYVPVSGFSTKPAKVYNGSSWVTKPTKIYNGSSWVTKPLKVAT